MSNTIRLKRGTTTPTAGSFAGTGEIAINTTTGTAYTLTDGGSVVQIGGGGSGSVAWGSITGTLSSQSDLNTALGLKAPLASPAFTGTPTAPTPATSDNSTTVATTAFVKASINPTTNFYTQGKNNTGSTIPAASVVYINGASGGVPLFVLAQANSSTASDTTFGVTMNSIANGSNGTVITAGILSNVNTSAWPVGTLLWLSPTTAGGLTSTMPSAPNHSVFIGFVTTQSSGSGQISINIQNGYHLEELHNVAISSPANQDLLSYNSSTSLWNNTSISSLG